MLLGGRMQTLSLAWPRPSLQPTRQTPGAVRASVQLPGRGAHLGGRDETIAVLVEDLECLA